MDDITLKKWIRRIMRAYRISNDEIASHIQKLDGTGRISRAHFFNLLNGDTYNFSKYRDQFRPAFNAVFRERNLPFKLDKEFKITYPEIVS